MRTHRFGRKMKLPATMAIKHQIMQLMLEELVKTEAAEARAEALPRAEALQRPPGEDRPVMLT